MIAPVKQGNVIGKVEVRQSDKVIMQADVVVLENVEECGFFRRMWGGIRLFFKGRVCGPCRIDAKAMPVMTVVCRSRR